MEKRQVAALRPRVVAAMATIVDRGQGEFRAQDLAILGGLPNPVTSPIRHTQWGTLSRLIGTYAQASASARPGERGVDDHLFGCVLWMVWYQLHYAGSWAATGTVRVFLDFVRAAQHTDAVREHAIRELTEMCVFLPESALAEVAGFLWECTLPGVDRLGDVLRQLGQSVPDRGTHGLAPVQAGTLPADASELERDAMQAAMASVESEKRARVRRRRAGQGWFAAAAALGVLATVLVVPVLRGPDTVDAAPPAAHLPIFPSPLPAASRKPGRVPEPAAIAIPGHGIAAYLIKLGKNKDGTLQVPSDFTHAGWFTGGARPGEAGSSIIAGHYDSYDGPAVFYRLHEMTAGDRIELLLVDGTAQRWIVQRVQRYPKDQFPTAEVYAKTKTPSLRVITCGGNFNRHKKSYDDNVVVYASLA